MEDTTAPVKPTPPVQQPASPDKSLSEILRIAKEKGEQTRSSSASLGNLAKSAGQKSTGARQEIKKGLSVAYSVLTGLANKEVRKEVKQYISKTPPPSPEKKPQ